MKLTIGLYGLYLLMVALKGNSAFLLADLQSDLPHYFPWLIVAAVMGALYDYPETHAFAAAFLLLIILSFLLTNYANVKQEFTTLYDSMIGTAA